MWRALIVSAWVGSGVTADTYRPRLGDDYTLESSNDITGQPQVPTTPNSYTVEVVCDDATLAAIDADPDYVVLESEVIPDVG